MTGWGEPGPHTVDMLVDGEWVAMSGVTTLEPDPEPYESTVLEKVAGMQMRYEHVVKFTRQTHAGFDALRALLDEADARHRAAMLRRIGMPRKAAAGPALLHAIQRCTLPASTPRCTPVQFDLDALAVLPVERTMPAWLRAELERVHAAYSAAHRNADPRMPRAMLERHPLGTWKD